MKYVSEINAFHSFIKTNKVSSDAIALWHAFWHLWNINGRAVPPVLDEVDAPTLMSESHIKRSNLYKAITELELLGLIHRETQGSNRSARYILISLFDSEFSTASNIRTQWKDGEEGKKFSTASGSASNIRTRWKITARKFSTASGSASNIRTHTSIARDSLEKSMCSQSYCQSDICVDDSAREAENGETPLDPPDCGKIGGKPVENPDSTGGIPGEAECRRLMAELPEAQRLKFENAAREEYKSQMGKEPRKQDILVMFGCIWWKRQRQGLPFEYNADECGCLELAVGACAEKEQVGALKSFPAYLKGIYKVWVQRQTFTVKQIEKNQQEHNGSGIGYPSW